MYKYILTSLLIISYPTESSIIFDCLLKLTNKEKAIQIENNKEDTILLFRKKKTRTRKDSMSKEYQADKQEVSNVYSKSITDGTKLNFEKNLQRLIRELSPKEKDSVNEALKNHYTVTSKRHRKLLWAKSGARFDSKTDSIIVVIPQEFIGTDVEYLIKLHETYHLVVEIIRKGKINDVSLRSMKKIEENLAARYFNEAGAMISDWQYINAIPKNIRKAIVKQIKLSKELSNRSRTFLIRAFEMDTKTASGYVLKEHQAGRYDFKYEEFELELKTNAELLSAITAGLIISSKHCTGLKKKNKFDSLFYKHICLKHPFFSKK